ncbi:MAG: hypothetical protein ACU84Q_16495 [Gammaproteobacteria bacterium]
MVSKHFLSCIAISLCGLLVACSQVESEFDRKRSPLGEADLIVNVAEPFMPHGKHKIIIYLAKPNEDAVKLLETTMENDGVPFTKKNIGLRWTSSTQALVCLRPTDLADKGVVIQLGSPSTAEIRDGC